MQTRVGIVSWRHTLHTRSSSRPSIITSHYHYDSRTTSLKLPADCSSLLPLVHSSSNLRLSSSATQHYVSTRNENNISVDEENVVPLYVSTPVETSLACRPIGWLRPQVLQALTNDHNKLYKKSMWDFQHDQNGLLRSVAFAAWVNAGGRHQRTLQMNQLVSEWRHEKLFTDILGGLFYK